MGEGIVVSSARAALRFIGGAAAVLERRLPTAITDLTGDRAIEWSWVAAKIPEGPGRALDFGPGHSYMPLVAARKGFDVVAADLRAPQWHFYDEAITVRRGDVMEMGLPEREFDVIINCSSIEHVGIAGRYGVTAAVPDGDIEVMRLFRRLLKPGGLMILTLPVGVDAVFNPLHRIYGASRLPRLIDGWTVEAEEYWVKRADNRWIRVPKDDALGRVPQPTLYGLGCMVLSDEAGDRRP